MRHFIAIAFLIAGVSAAFGQQPSASPPPPQQQPPAPSPAATPRPVPVTPQQPGIRSVRMLEREINPFPINPVSESDRLAARVVELQRLIGPLYRKPSAKELSELQPNPATMRRYAAFLEQDDTGIFQIVPDTGCVYSNRVVSAKEGCLKFAFPGAGNSYSFRTGSHRLRHLADLTFVEGKLQITGLFMHGIVTRLGPVAIENVDLNTSGMSFLTGFEPSRAAEHVVEIDASLQKGIDKGEFHYSKSIQPEVGMTYALRAVAYRGRVARSAGGVRYNELDYDKRRDVIVAFSVVEADPDGALTIVWTKLRDLESPKIKLPERGRDDDDDREVGN